MAFVLESVLEWGMARLLGTCLKVHVPQDAWLYADPQVVYEYLFADGVRTWARKIAYVAWLKEAMGTIKGFLTLCRINRLRLR